MMLRTKVVLSIFKRNFFSYFSGVLGYLFIVVFVVAGGLMAFNAQFFTANEPTLDQLTRWYPLLLLFFVPAVTMSVWAEERKSGTDELLFTLPATDTEVLAGKYLAVLAVYTLALAFSTTHVLVLTYLGNPDWGLLATTYFGYWVAGASMLTAGMLASSLCRSVTVAFVYGVIICSGPVFIEHVGEFLGLGRQLAPLSLTEQFRDFGMGVIPLTGLMYFLTFAAVMLYLNLILIKKRIWPARSRVGMGSQFAIRACCLAITLVCVTSWFGYAALRVDATSERLFSLSPTTQKTLGELTAQRPIEIQAFLSPEVPREYAETRKQLVGLLRQFDELGGNRLQVRYVDVEPFSKAAEEARHFGIEPVTVMTEEDGRRSDTDVYLGAVVLSSYDTVVVPFFGKGLPIEYELTRSVRTVANEQRHKVGVLRTDAGLMSGSREWRIITELKKQYDLVEVSPASDIDGDEFDVLLAALPSSLTAPEMDNLVEYVKSGRPALIFDDPFPLTFNTGFGVSNAPRQPKRKPGGHMGMMGRGGPRPEPKADGGRASRLLQALDLRWQYDRVVFDLNNPHPEFGSLPPEYVFITKQSGNENAFNADSPITSGLEELIGIYSGAVEHRDENSTEFIPLLATGGKSGLLGWTEFVDDSGFNFFSMEQTAQPRRNPLRRLDPYRHVIAAQVTKAGGEQGENINAIFVSDIDMISDYFFQERTLGNLGIDFDNVTFVLNAVDSLAGDDSFIELRSRRARHRTLKRVEEQKRTFLEHANKAEQDADRAADGELAQRREQLKKRAEEITKNEDLDPIAKAQMLRQAQESEQQRMRLAEAQIEQQKNREVGKIRAQTNRQIREMESRIQLWAVWLPPIPALLLGLVVFTQRWSAERRTVVDRRRKREE